MCVLLSKPEKVFGSLGFRANLTLSSHSYLQLILHSMVVIVTGV